VKNKLKEIFSTKYMLSILTVICAVLICITFFTDKATKPIKNALSYVIVPLQSGVNNIGLWISDSEQRFKTLEELIAENEELKKQNALLTEQNNKLIQDGYELDRLREMYALDKQYDEYEKVGAKVIAKETGNWFHSFTVDKGYNDGIKKDMNVISGGGLVGIVTDVGPNYSKVRSIIDDANNVSAMIPTTGDNFNVSGDLKQMNESMTITFSGLRDADNEVHVGDPVVTSYVSDQYQQGILIGYISTIEDGPNNLTKIGTITPVVDFEHLEEVLVITKIKETGNELTTEE